MAALAAAKNNLVKGMAPMEGLLKDLLDKDYITQDIYDRVKADEDLGHHFKVKAKKTGTKKTSAKKTVKTSTSKEEKNKEEIDWGRCYARKWESDGGLGYDSIQCSSCKMIRKGVEAEKIMEEFKGKMDEEQLARLPSYLEQYDGCFCKNHLKQDFFMPNGWWLGKVNEKRPEKPMLPKGSFKDGYQEEYKEHRWMYDEDGNNNERLSNRGRKPKELAIEDDEKNDEVEQVEEVQADEDDGAGTGLKPKEDPEPEEEEDHEEKPYIVEGIKYSLMWDEDDKEWCVTTDDGGMIGWPEDDGEGKIRFIDDEEEEAHRKRVEEKE